MGDFEIKPPACQQEQGLIHSAQNKNARTISEKKNAFSVKKDGESVLFGRNPYGFQFLCAFFSRVFALWRTFVRRRRQNHGFCILMNQPLFANYYIFKSGEHFCSPLNNYLISFRRPLFCQSCKFKCCCLHISISKCGIPLSSA